MVRRCSPATSWHSSPRAAGSLPSLAMWSAFPTSDYYEGSAPTRAHQSTTDLPATALAGRRGGRPRAGSHVHHAPVDGGGAQLCPAASPHLRRRPSLWPPHRHSEPASESTTHKWWSCTADRPTSTRLEPACRLRSFTRWFKLRLHLPVTLAGPGPSGGADPSRRCRGCSHPHLRPQARTPPSFNGLLRQANGGVLHLQRVHGASWRTRTRDRMTMPGAAAPRPNGICLRDHAVKSAFPVRCVSDAGSIARSAARNETMHPLSVNSEDWA